MQQISGARKSANARGYTYRWQQASKAFLAAHPLCQCPDCRSGQVRLRAASVVDHEPPHRGDMAKFWDRTTWRAMAKECHDAKTAAQDGGFGNRKKNSRIIIGADGWPIAGGGGDSK